MSAQIISKSGQVQEVVDMPDIFDVLEGGEDQNAVKYLLGFGGKDGGAQQVVEVVSSMNEAHAVEIQSAPATAVVAGVPQAVVISQPGPMHGDPGAKTGKLGKRMVRKRDTSGLKAIYSCQCCGKAFTTKFNLKRHINMHCYKSKEACMPIIGPPSANIQSKKPIQHRMPKPNGGSVNQTFVMTAPGVQAVQPNPIPVAAPSEAPTIRIVSSSSSSVPAENSASSPLSYSIPVEVVQSMENQQGPMTIINSGESGISMTSPVPQHTVHHLPKPITVINPNAPMNTVPGSPSSVQNIVSPCAVSTSIPLVVSTGSSVGIPTAISPDSQASIAGESSLASPTEPLEPAPTPTEDNATLLNILNGGLSIAVRKPIVRLPAGWVRKPVHDYRGIHIFYYNTAGKKFASLGEVEAFFARLGFQVASDVFDFEVSDVDRTLAGGGPLLISPRDAVAVKKTLAASSGVGNNVSEKGDSDLEEEDDEEDEEVDV